MLYATSTGRRLRAQIAMFPDTWTRFKRIIADCGYQIYPVNPRRRSRSGHKHMLIFHTNEPTVAAIVYIRSDDTIVVRPSSGFEFFNRVKNRLSLKRGRDFKLLLGAEMKFKGQAGHPWTDWLTKTDRNKLRKIGVKFD